MDGGQQPLMEAGQPAGPISLDDPGNFASGLAETAGEAPPPPEIALDDSIGMAPPPPGPAAGMPPIEELMKSLDQPTPANRNQFIPEGAYQDLWAKNRAERPEVAQRAQRRLMGSAPAGKTEMAAPPAGGGAGILGLVKGGAVKEASIDVAALGAALGALRAPKGNRTEGAIRGGRRGWHTGIGAAVGGGAGVIGGALTGAAHSGGKNLDEIIPLALAGGGLGMLGGGAAGYGLSAATDHKPSWENEGEMPEKYRQKLLNYGTMLPGVAGAGLGGVAGGMAGQAVGHPVAGQLLGAAAGGIPAAIGGYMFSNKNLPQATDKAAAIVPHKPTTRNRERYKMRLRLPLPQEPEKLAAALAWA